MRVLSFEVGGERFAIDTAVVVEILRPLPITPVPRAPIAGLINVRGQIIPAVDLRVRLGHPAIAAAGMNVLVQTSSGLASLLVDRIGDVFETEPSQFSPPPPTLPPAVNGLVIGTLALADRLVLVLDVDRATRPADDGLLS